MNILIVAWRAWSAASRYKSLMVNAQREGHKVMCIASRHLGDSDLTMAALKDIGVQGVRGDNATVNSLMNKFKADAVFGEYYWHVAEEDWAQAWAIANRKPHFLLDHNQYHGFCRRSPPPRWNRSYLLAVNEGAAEAARVKGWSQIHVVGEPDLDVIDRDIDVKKVRSRLRCEEKQPLVAIFLEHISGTGSPHNRSLDHEKVNMRHFIKIAKQKGWRLVAHCHAQERQAVNQLYHPQRASYLKWLQDQGVTFVAGWAPGTVAGGAKFEKCTWHELILAANIVTGTTITPIFATYACGKRYFVFYGGDRYGINAQSVGRKAFARTQKMPNYSSVGSGFRNIIAAAEQDAGSVEQEPSFTEQWFYKLDGNCWKRMLQLAGA